MGLDNGIVLRVKGKIDPEDRILSIPGIEKDDWYEENHPGFSQYDICYWRKCWNIRDILFVNCDDAKGKDDCGTYSLTIDELEAIRHSLYLTICEGPDAWNDGDQSIWDFEEIMNQLPWDLVRISALIDYMEKNGGRCEAFFYDSY